MATTLPTPPNTESQKASAGFCTVVPFLRLEGLAATVLSAVFYARTGASWWLFAALWLAPDLSILGYLAGPKWGARIYNSIHSYVTPATLAAMAMFVHSSTLLPVALIWINHIGVDRLMGYGLKYPNGFGWTHLGKMGKQRKEAIPAGQSGC
jgi:Domain of unknown function (DUF4260)